MMRRNLLLALSILVLFGTLSCTKFSRDNPFDPAATKTVVFADTFESYFIGTSISAPWLIYDPAFVNGAPPGKFHAEWVMPMAVSKALRVEYNIAMMNSMIALYQEKVDALYGVVGVEFDLKMFSAAMQTGSDFAFEIADTGNSASVKAGFGCNINFMDMNKVLFFTEDGKGIKYTGFTGVPNKAYKISITLDFNRSLMNVYITDGNVTTLIAEDISVNLPEKASRFQFRVFTGNIMGNTPFLEIDNFSIARYGDE